MNAQPHVSIIVRTYNRPERLHESLHSISQQTYPVIEVVVVNDAGVEVEEIIQTELGPIQYRYVQNSTNRGRTASLNIGIELAHGDYIAFLDDDDILYPEHVSVLMQAALPNRLPVVYSDVLNVTYQQALETGEWKRIQEQLVYSFDFEKDNFLLANYIPINCLLIRSDCFEAIGPFDESLSVYEDWDYLIRLSRTFPFYHVAKITGEYRRRDDNSNILERERYPINEQVVKRRYRDDRDGIFDGIFKRTFQQRREMREQTNKFQQLARHTAQLQTQLAESKKVILQLQQEVIRLRRERGNP
jgi:glycosyltransferase involved in cell wall biosynthesis